MDQISSGALPCGRSQPNPSIAIVGAGRAGAALGVALRRAGLPVVAVSSRAEASAHSLAALLDAGPPTSPDLAARRAEITFLTVPDGAIQEVAASIAEGGPRGALAGHTVVHCAAAHDRELLAVLRQSGAAVAGLHPLQALSGASSAANLRGSAFALDADPDAEPPLRALVASLAGTVLAVAPDQRTAYHAAAVLAGNAPLALLARAVELLGSTGMDPDLAARALAGLMVGAASNALEQGAAAALTGPVARDDALTVARHLSSLADRPELLRLYRSLADETLELAGRATHPAVAALLTGAAVVRAVPRDTAA